MVEIKLMFTDINEDNSIRRQYTVVRVKVSPDLFHCDATRTHNIEWNQEEI